MNTDKMRDRAIEIEVADESASRVSDDEAQYGLDAHTGSSRSKSLERISVNIDDIVEGIAPIVDSIDEYVSGCAENVDEFSMEVGLKISAKGNVFIASGGTDVHIKMNVKWKNKNT